MAHFAKVVDGIVEQVIVADDKEWCETHLGGQWVQTSYNTLANQHPNNTPLHKNYAGIGYTWDGTGFAPPKPYPSWTLDEETYVWEPPVAKPDGAFWSWNESTQQWDRMTVN